MRPTPTRRLNLESLEGREVPAGLLLASPLNPADAVVTRAAVVGADPAVGSIPIARSLVGTVSALTVTNETRGVLNFQIRWSTTGEWKSYSLQAGFRQTYFNNPLPGVGFAPGAPRPAQIRFDYSFQTGFQERVYTLASQNVTEGTQAGKGAQYVFKPSGNGVDLYRR